MEAIYLDTHIIAWLHVGDLTKLSEKVVHLIENREAFYSSIVKLELQYLYEIGRLRTPPETILKDLEGEVGLKVKDSILTELIHEANKLSWTRDPFDRMITAQASILNLPLITKDKTIRQHYEQAVW